MSSKHVTVTQLKKDLILLLVVLHFIPHAR